MEALGPRMEEAGAKLGALLRAGLADALAAGNAPARQHCLQAFAAVGDAAGAEQARSGVPSPCAATCAPCSTLVGPASAS